MWLVNKMKLFWFCCFTLTLLNKPSDGGILREKLGEPEGPPVPHSQSLKRTSEPRPPSTIGIQLKAPAPPPPGEGPQPPAPPDPHILELFEKSPENFPAAYAQWQQEQEQQANGRDGRAVKQRTITYDQFVTAAVVIGLDLQRSIYSMFAPSDAYLNSLNISLSATALRDPECIRQIVRSHTVLGRLMLSDRMEDVAMSLEDSPVFICAKEANGVEVLRANIETDYGTVHIIDGLMDRPRLMDSCPTLKQRLSSGEGQQAENIKSNHSISIRRVSEEDLLASFEYDPSIRTNEIDQNTFDTDVVIVPFVEQSDQSLTEANIPLELLVNIDNFAHAVKLTWQTEDNVMAILQSLGASTFLALLERSDLMDTLTRQGPWTVFAPDNEAWQALPKEIFDHIIDDPVLLRQILSYHIVQANATRRHLINDEKLPSLYENRPIHINFYTDGWASWYTASGSQISNLDELASNGVVHVVRSVLLPPLGDFYSVVKWTPALQTTFSMLQSVADPAFTNKSVSLTAFLPADGPVLDALLVGSSPSKLTEILRRHVVRGTWFTAGLIDGDHLLTFDNQVLTVRRDANCVGISHSGINTPCIAVRDITLTNGVLHVIDNLVLN
ncbi:transforming growth factor-beta-induced protein ig-h3 [Daphnia magna]|uniref:transforming growth factor-beta-induced protein ig-h3 n=1 Tax=Daphnia magna TaxID=35525 RepID=UPI0006DF02C0|nr:transforming growth factor-beta-induced protein ig-h3 [Daphnia magna]